MTWHREKVHPECQIDAEQNFVLRVCSKSKLFSRFFQNYDDLSLPSQFPVGQIVKIGMVDSMETASERVTSTCTGANDSTKNTETVMPNLHAWFADKIHGAYQ